MTWRKRTIMEMAREAGWDAHHAEFDTRIETFAELVREDERNRTWTQEHWTEYERNIAAAEREAILDLVDGYAKNNTDLAEAIRARGQA